MVNGVLIGLVKNICGELSVKWDILRYSKKWANPEKQHIPL
jgi:hypothetical protein